MTRPPRRRPARIAALVREALAEAVTTRLKDPRVGFVTITGVSVSPDGAQASVRVSILGDDEAKQRTVEGLNSARGFLRSHLAQALALRVTPELNFHLDHGLEHAQRIDEVLASLQDEPPDDGEDR